MKTSKIEWTERTWNPVTGCTKISPGCQHCYAEVMANRLHAMGQAKYANNFKSTMHEEEVTLPLSWTQPSLVFVCSMSDLFHPDVSFEFIDKILNVMEITPHHTYQLLTKRANRMQEYFSKRKVPDNVWVGVTIESSITKHRIDCLNRILASTKFISFEPLLDDIGDIDLSSIQWVIVGGESGPKARRMEKEWVLSIKKKANENNVPFFFKQWGSWGEDSVKRSKKANGRTLDGKIYSSMPK